MSGYLSKRRQWLIGRQAALMNQAYRIEASKRGAIAVLVGGFLAGLIGGLFTARGIVCQ